MPDQRPQLRRGRIVWVTLTDPKGHLKHRPAIVLTPTNEIRPDQSIAVMAISTSYPEPPPPNFVELPWHNDHRRVSTRLSKRSAAVLNWLRLIEHHEINEFAGDVPPNLLLAILRLLEKSDG